MNGNEALAKRLIMARAWAGMSQNDLARRAGIAQTQLSRYETARSQPRRAALDRLAGELGISPAWLALGNGDAHCGCPIQSTQQSPIDLAIVSTQALLNEVARRCS
ncbi:helix-turn-helix transcriptional regulator [Delftia acidovorans]|uniref:Helix-turn-helix transcriptional regulator n=1 Tax=Delftia acidovorans TaxID=80866 RepID=A0A7T2S629_DELAC|nr:helix-turn-helix transcriptional regulator [Delftia acidovorans]QPS09559.1 helix-turn-helix transcriptional regulator [Delftia acidovorans]